MSDRTDIDHNEAVTALHLRLDELNTERRALSESIAAVHGRINTQTARYDQISLLCDDIVNALHILEKQT